MELKINRDVSCTLKLNMDKAFSVNRVNAHHGHGITASHSNKDSGHIYISHV